MLDFNNLKKSGSFPYFVEVSLCCLFLIIMFFQREFLIYRDFSILWHGALLISDGYSPFKDFIMPISPVSIYLCSFFLILFNKTWFVFQITQMIFSIGLLIIVCTFLNELEKKKIVVQISLGIFTLFYLLLLTHPWYNNFGAFFLLLACFLAFQHSQLLIFFCGVISTLALFTKLDFGVFTFCSSIVIIFYNSLHSRNYKFSSSILIFLFGFFISSFFLISQFQEDILGHTIQTYKEISSSRSNRFIKFFELKNILLSILGLLCVFFLASYQKHFLTYGLIILSACATSILGGMEHTHYYYIFTIPPILFFCWYESKLKWTLFFLVPISIFLLTPAVRLSIHSLENIYFNHYDSEFFNHRNIAPDAKIINLNNCSKKMVNVYGPKDYCQIKDIIKKQFINKDLEENFILNITELNFIGAELGILPLKNHPLWYKTSQTVTKKFQQALDREIINGQFEMVLIQRVRKGYSSQKIRVKMIEDLQKNQKYSEINKIFESPMCLMLNNNLDDCGIHIFIRK